MEHQDLSAGDAVKAHRGFLQEVLAEVMKIMSAGNASDERLIASLGAYWEASLARRDVRRAVLAATQGSEFERAVEPMGKPFLLMVRAELMPRRGKQADELALAVYDEARAIAVDEALCGERVLARRQALIARIRA